MCSRDLALVEKGDGLQGTTPSLKLTKYVSSSTIH